MNHYICLLPALLTHKWKYKSSISITFSIFQVFMNIRMSNQSVKYSFVEINYIFILVFEYRCNKESEASR